MQLPRLPTVVRKQAPLIIVAALVTLACLPLVAFGPQYGHSFAYDINWARGFDDALKSGELYPRWLPALNGGGGSPVFFFYAPVPFYFHALGELVSGSATASVQLGVAEWLIVLASAFAFYGFARTHAQPIPSALGALMYALMPYHFAVDAWIRQALGELAAYIFLPLILRSVDRIARERRGPVGVAVFYALLIATHLPTTVLSSGFVALYVLVAAYRDRRPAIALVGLGGMGLGGLLAGLYLVPALLLQRAISVEALWASFFEYQRWFFGATSPEPVFSKRLLQVLLVSSAAFAGFFLIVYRGGSPTTRGTLWLWLSFVLGAWFLMTPLSGPLWQAIPTLQKVQFPWRVAVVLDLAVSAVAVLAMKDLGAPKNLPAGVAAGLAVCLIGFSMVLAGRSALLHFPLSQSAARQAEVERMLAAGLDADEYIPNGVTLRPAEVRNALRSMPAVRLVPESGTLRVVRWEPRRISMQAELETPAEGIVRQFHFPGWQARSSDSKREIRIERVPPTGVMRLALPAGRYEVELALERLPEEKLGALLSLIGAFGLGIVSFWHRAIQRATPRRAG